jgi:hypothetical protein
LPDPHEAFLSGLIDEKVDIALDEMRARFGTSTI